MDKSDFKSAYDEDTYALWTLDGGGPSFPSRLLSRQALRTLFELCGHSWDFTFIAADALFPILCALAAWVLSGRVVPTPVLRLSLAIALLFGQEFLSFGCSAIWNFDRGPWNLHFLRAAFLPWGRELVPDYYTSYFSLFRTPEPQVTLPIFFCMIAILVRIGTSDPHDLEERPAILLLLTSSALGFLNFFFAAGLVVFGIVCAAAFALHGKRNAARLAILVSSMGFASFTVANLAYRVGTGAQDSATVLFRSRLPILTPASAMALFCLGILGLRFRQVRCSTGQVAVAGACFTAILILTNQQIITGWMISTRDWERYVNYPLLVLGLALCLCASRASRPKVLQEASWRTRTLAVGFLVFAAWLLVRGQRRVFNQFLFLNAETFAMQQSLARIGQADFRHTNLLLDEPELAPLLQFRMKGRLRCQLDYTDIFVYRIEPMKNSDGAWGLRSPFKKRLFDYFARTGRSPGDVARILTEEVNRRAGFFLGFLFNMADYWYPVTDDRQVRQKEIRATIPRIVRNYEDYLASRPLTWLEPTVRLTSQPLTSLTLHGCWRERLLTRGEGLEGVRVNALLQTPFGQCQQDDDFQRKRKGAQGPRP